MSRSGVLILIVAVATSVGAAAWYMRLDTPPSCTSEPTLNEVSAVLHDRYQLDSIFLNDIRTVRGGWFSRNFECSAEEASIQGNQNIADLPWRGVHYSVMHLDGAPDFAVVAEVDGPTPFVRQRLSFWQRLLGGR